jgi:type IV fimbrial biogenesis protein FimT
MLSCLRGQAGFSIIELMVVLAIFAVLAGIAAPNLQGWLRIYRLKSAAMDLYANMQQAKASAVRENMPWKLRFNTTSKRYDVLRCLTNTCQDGALNTDYQISKTIVLSDKYQNAVQYKNPDSTTVVEFTNSLATFNPNGLVAGPGYVYLSNDQTSTYYRVGFKYITGAVRVERRNGTNWE